MNWQPIRQNTDRCRQLMVAFKFFGRDRQRDNSVWKGLKQGARLVTPPTHRGFGTRIIENLVGQFKGKVHFDWRGHGLACKIVLPLA